MSELTFAPATDASIPLSVVAAENLEDWISTLSARDAAWARSSGYTAGAGQVLTFPDDNGNVGSAVVGLGSATSARRTRFRTARARGALPVATYKLNASLASADLSEFALGWLLAGYRFQRYAGTSKPLAGLLAPDGIDASHLEAIAAGEALARDLINIPASDMGPSELEIELRELAQVFEAQVSVVHGPDLLDSNFPMIHAVGRASHRAPRLLELTWGTSGPRLTLVGKGVCFDTGGLNLKPGASMGLMKKDMGGAANVLGLARMIMATKLNVQLRVLIPAVENAVGGSAFRPGDILTSRKGLTVEINNTDAEGRLVLADALALADEEKPDLIVSMATLTGAARVAVGPDLAPFYTDHDSDAATLEAAARACHDPVWRLPFWDAYEGMIEPGIADLDNAPKGGFAGSITAALFLRRFVTETPRYMHFDIYGWQPSDAPARPKGGAGQGIRALFQALPDLLG